MVTNQDIPEKERLIKKYELDEAVVTVIGQWKDETNTRFEEIKTQLIAGFKGIATTQYVDDKIKTLSKDLDLKYGNPIKSIDKFKWIVFTGLFGAFMQLATFFMLGGFKK